MMVKRLRLRFTERVWKSAINLFMSPEQQSGSALMLGSRVVALRMVRHARARRYLLRLCPDGTARVTIPRRGTLTEARALFERNRAWLEHQLVCQQSHSANSSTWVIGGKIWFRGELVPLEALGSAQIRFGSEVVEVDENMDDLRATVESRMRRMATNELTAKVFEHAARHRLPVKRITVRGQKSRWGSCSCAGTISLNWRLIQTPDWVRDYIILHELAHLKHMNHSARFWREVENMCPGYLLAEKWLKNHRDFLR